MPWYGKCLLENRNPTQWWVLWCRYMTPSLLPLRVRVGTHNITSTFLMGHTRRQSCSVPVTFTLETEAPMLVGRSKLMPYIYSIYLALSGRVICVVLLMGSVLKFTKLMITICYNLLFEHFCPKCWYQNDSSLLLNNYVTKGHIYCSVNAYAHTHQGNLLQVKC